MEKQIPFPGTGMSGFIQPGQLMKTFYMCVVKERTLTSLVYGMK